MTRNAVTHGGIVFGTGGIITVMPGPGGIVRLNIKTSARGEWTEVVLGPDHAARLAEVIQAALK